MAQTILNDVSAAPSGALTRELLTGSTYAARTEGSGYLRRARSMDAPTGLYRTPYLSLASSPPTGALTRELLTGSTYAARTEGSGYWRNAQVQLPGSAVLQWLVDGYTDVQFTPLAASVLTWECNGAGEAYFVGSADVAITWLVGGATRVDFGSIGRWQVQGATSVLFGGLWFSTGWAEVSFTAGAAAATPTWTVMGAGSMGVRPRVVIGGGGAGGGLVHDVFPGGGDDFPFTPGGGGSENVAY